MIMAALAEGKTIQEIAQFYADSFFQDEERVNILAAHVFSLGHPPHTGNGNHGGTVGG